MGEELVLRHTGELVDLEDGRSVAWALKQIRELEDQLRDAKSILSTALEIEKTRRGKGTMDFGDIKAVVATKNETIWDIEVLEQLLELGLPDERFNELVTTEYSYKVNASVAKQIAAANSDYAKVIESAKTVIEKKPTVTLQVQRG